MLQTTIMASPMYELTIDAMPEPSTPRRGEAPLAEDEQHVEQRVEQVHRDGDAHEHARTPEPVEPALVRHRDDHREDAGHAPLQVRDAEAQLLGHVMDEVEHPRRGEPAQHRRHRRAGGGDDDRVEQDLTGAAVVLLAEAARGQRLGADGERGERTANGPEEIERGAERGLTRDRFGRGQAADEDVVDPVDQGLADHRDDHGNG